MFLALLGAGTSPALSYRAGVEPIGPGRYFETVKREIDAASSSITASLYLFALHPGQPDSMVGRLARALAEARKRGVDVEVLLDQNRLFSGDPSSEFEAKNRHAYEYLRSNGVRAGFDGPASYSHSKLIVIDESVVILGSTNWSRESFTRNAEADVLIRSTEAAREYLDRLAAVVRQDLADPDVPATGVPLEFLVRKDLLGRMVSATDGFAFTVYTSLLKAGREKESSDFDLDFDAFAGLTGVANIGKNDYRRKITRTLRNLAERYGLLDCSFSPGGDARITLRPFQGETVALPDTFWTWGWQDRLSLRAKALYLIALRSAALSQDKPRWTRSQKSLEAEFHVGAQNLSPAVTELRRADLLEVRYGPNPLAPGDKRDPSVYSTNSLYDPAALEGAFKRLEARHGAEKVRRARDWAALVYEDSDLDAVKELVRLEGLHGARRIEEAAGIIGKKSPSNPKRNMGYFIGTIKGLK